MLCKMQCNMCPWHYMCTMPIKDGHIDIEEYERRQDIEEMEDK